MIPQAYITEWSQQVPWQSNEQVEQDLVICRALVEIFSELRALYQRKKGRDLYDQFIALTKKPNLDSNALLPTVFILQFLLLQPYNVLLQLFHALFFLQLPLICLKFVKLFG